MNINKKRGIRALIATGVAGAGLMAASMTGAPAGGQQYDPCYNYNKTLKISYNCTPVTRPEITTTTEVEQTTTTAAQTTTTTEPTTPTTGGPTPTTATPTTPAPTTAPSGTGGAVATPARPIAAQASYTG